MPPLSDPHQGRGRALLGSAVLFFVLPPVFVVLRLWARRLKRTPLCFNDYAIVLGMIFSCGYNANQGIQAIAAGWGQHMSTLTPSELSVFLKGTVAATFLWPSANTFVKLSILHLYTTIFSIHELVYVAYALGALTLAYWLSTILTAFLLCTPFAYNWDKLIVGGHCGNASTYYLSTAIVNLLIDVAIVALPLPILWGLQMKTSRKIALTAIFSLGVVICAVSIVRIIATKRLMLNADVTYHNVLDDITTALEPTLGVINACLPVLQPVVSKLSGTTSLVWSRWRSSNAGTSHERLRNNGTAFEHANDPKSRRFHRLPADLYPLTDVTVTQSDCTGPDNRTDSDKDGGSIDDESENHSGIKVKQHVGVNSTIAPRS